MRTIESTEICEVVDRFPEWARQKLRDVVVRVAEAYRASGVAMEPLAETRRRYREAHPDERPPDGGKVLHVDFRQSGS